MKQNETIFAKQEAIKFRNSCGLGLLEPLNIESLLLRLDVKTVFLPLENVSGMAVKVEKTKQVHRFILVNSNHSIGRQNFTICHELYHLFIQESFTSQLCHTGLFEKKNIEEYKADLFASALLMPEDGVQDILINEEIDVNNKTSLRATILKLEQYFQCSRQAILNKLYFLGYNEFKKGTTLHTEFTKKIMQQAQEYGYDLSLYKSGNHNKVIGDYGKMAKKAFDTDKISESHYASLMEQIFIDIYAPQEDEPE